jgi:hypothetical protein
VKKKNTIKIGLAYPIIGMASPGDEVILVFQHAMIYIGVPIKIIGIG